MTHAPSSDSRSAPKPDPSTGHSQRRSTLFRQESIEQASSVEQLDQLLQITQLKDWIPLAAIGTLLLVALIWSIVGRIPTFVEAKGLLLSAPETSDRLISISYFPISSGKQIEVGDPMLLVPNTVNIQEFGGLKATVVEVSPLSVTEAEALARLGGKQELLDLVYTPAAIEVIAELEPDEANPTGYQWSIPTATNSLILSSEIPTYSMVMLGDKAPITYVFPFFDRP